MTFPIITAFTYALSMTLAKKTSEKDSLFQQTFHIYIGSFIGGSVISVLIYNSDINFNILDNLNNPWILNDIQTVIFILLIGVLGSLGFLGLGLPESVPEWGNDLNMALEALPTGVWWTALYPGLAMFILVMGLSFIGEGLEGLLSGFQDS